MKILVTGASGVLGSAVLKCLETKRAAARAMTRGDLPGASVHQWVRADLVSGKGLDAALSDIEAVIHCASTPFEPESDITAIERLIDAASRARNPLIVNAGIVGIERASRIFRYYEVKLEVEKRLQESGLAYSLVRAAQFHALIDFLLLQGDDGANLNVASDVTLRSVSVEFAAECLVETAMRMATGRQSDVHGPDVLTMADMARVWLDARSLQRKIVAKPAESEILQAFSHLDISNQRAGGESWKAWVERNASAVNPYAKWVAG